MRVIYLLIYVIVEQGFQGFTYGGIDASKSKETQVQLTKEKEAVPAR